MNNLFVFGNGFDLEHNLKTSYKDFKYFLIKNYKIDLNDEFDFILPSYATNYRRLEEYDEKEFANLFLHLINDCSFDIEKWKDFEECLGKIDWYKIFENDYPLIDIEDEYSFRDRVDFCESKANSLQESSHILKTLFYRWILFVETELNDLKSNEIIKKFKNYFDNNDYFLSFNYTSTLEKLYNINNVCHIHGSINQYNKLIVGHGFSEYTNYHYDEFFDEANISIETIFNDFKKDTCLCYKEHIDFFNNLKNISDIYFYGFSFSNVDMFYIKKIKSIVNDSVKIHVNIHKKEDQNDIFNKLEIFINVDLWKI